MLAPLSNEELDVLALCAVATVQVVEVRKRPRKKWCKDWLMKKEMYSHIKLLNELKQTGSTI